MASGNANTFSEFNGGLEFDGFAVPEQQSYMKPAEDNTSAGFYFDEGIDTSGGASFGQQSFDSTMFASNNSTGFAMQQPLMDNTSGSASWGNVGSTTFPPTPAQSFDSMYDPHYSTALGKHPLQLDVQDYPQSKRHETFPISPYQSSASVTGSSWDVDTQLTPSSSTEIGLSDEAADLCATWFSKYNVLPSDRHIASLSQLTGESPTAIRHWFGQALKQGMTSHDSAYKSQTGGFTTQEQIPTIPQLPQFAEAPEAVPEALHPTLSIEQLPCNYELDASTTTASQPPLRGGRKGCNRTNDPELLKRDPNKMYQCTRKCGKRYGRKCDWKRNEEEGYPSKSWICSLCTGQGVERVKPCFRKYHFSQHFRNIHPGLNAADFEESSLVHSDTAFPRKCGFCPHRFTTRQERIDHIGDHFKQGKCMLDWNDDEDDSHDDDNMDDDDDNNDRPDSGGGFGNNKPFYPPAPQGGSGPKYNGNGGGGYGGQQPPQGGFFQFQLQQYNNPAGEHESPIAERHIKLTSTDHFKQRSTHGWHSVEKKDNADVVARDAIFKSQVLKEASVCEQSPASSLASSSHRVKAFTTPSPYHLTENGEKAKEDVTNTVTPTSTLEALSDPKKHAQACEDTRLKLRSVEDRGDSAYWLLVVLKLVEAVAIEEQRKSNSHGEVKDQSSDLIFSMSNRGIVPNYLALLNSGVRDEALSTYRALWREVFRQYEEHFEKLTGEACSLRRPPRPSLLPPPPLLIGYNTNIGQPFLGVFTGRSGSDQHTSTHLTQSSCLGSDKLDAMAFFASITSRTLTPISLEVFEHSLPAGLITGLGAEAAVLRSELHAQKLRIPIESAPETLLQCWKGITTLLDSQSFLSVKLLGTGGFSTVDEVVHRETSLRISRKTLKNREESALEELKKEVNVLQKLRHPHIIRFLGAYSKGDKMSILLSPVAETTLALWLDNTMSSKQEGLAQTIVKMYGCLASSIRYLHEQRPVVKHMDIKPQNILVMHGNQDFPHVVLSDFGISSFDNTASHEKSKPLTRQYCAPEVSEGISREQAADIWSLGCVYAEMASAAFRDDNPRWLDFRQEFSGREGKYYWQDISSLQEWLSVFLDRASTLAEATVVRTVKSMLSAEPVERPSASLLTMIFTPAPCCLNWPNDKVTYPGPLEELRTVEMLVHDDVVDCRTQLHLHSSADDKEQPDSFSRAKGWLNECFHDHDTCRRQPNEAKSLPARLVDIQPNGIGSTFVRIVDTAELDLKTVSVDYIAVSYVWSENDVTLSTELLQAMQSELPREALPKAMNEAISATDRVGYRYIWVDSLCVLQDSEDDKQRECKAMVSIYRNAALTMVLDQLSDTTDAQPGMSKDSSSSGGANSALRFTSSITSGVGISGRIEHQLTASASLPAIDFLTPGFAWDTRAWALQERLLSRRLLVLGQEQMYWECNALKASETFPRGLPPLLWEKVHTKPSPDVRPIHIKCEHATGSRLGDPDELLRRSVRALGPRLLRNCQWIKKEGDGIGDAMEAAQMELELPVLEVKAHTIDNVKSKIHGDDRQGGDDTATSGHAPISGLTDDFGLPTKVEGHQLLPTTASLLPANREPQDNFFHHNDFTQGGRSAFDCPTSCGVGDALIDNKAHPTIFSGQSDSFGSLGGPSCNDSIAEDVKPNFPYGKNITLDANGAECAHPTPRRAQREPFDWYCCKCDDGPVPNDDVAVQIKQDVDVEESFGSRKDKRDEHNGNVHDGMVMKVDDEDVDVDMDRD